MSDYEKQLEEANQKLRDQLEREIARADALEAKLKMNTAQGQTPSSMASNDVNKRDTMLEWIDNILKRNK